jgi:Leucine-rich repeat (LRR) protein
LIIFALFILTSPAHGIIFNCRFLNETWNYIGNNYQCKLSSVTPGNSSALEQVNGVHYEWKDNLDVETISASNLDLKVLPKRIANFFPHIRGIFLGSSNLWQITVDDLKQFPFLMYLNLDGNKIIALENDLFRYTPRLVLVDFDDNLIFHVGEDTFKNLKFITRLNFLKNPCYSGSASDSYWLPKLIQGIKENCPPLIFSHPTTTTAPTSAP